MKKKFEKGLKFIDDLKENANAKTILFFGFYFIFFLVLVLLVRFAPKHIINPDQYEKSKPLYFSSEVLKNNNYHFKYIVYLDEYTYEYEGDKFNELELFEYNNSSYFNNNNTFYKKGESWEKVDNPYRFNKFFSGKSISDLINNSYYQKSTRNEDNTSYHELDISSNTINKILDNKDSDVDEVPNKIIIYADSDGELDKISFNLDSYCKVIDGCQNTLKIDLEYSNAGKIQDIKNPISSEN